MMKNFEKRSANVPQRQVLIPSTLTFPVVGMGASAGGLQALKSFFEQMPQDSGMAFVVVLHLSPDHESVADRVLQSVTRMPVRQVIHALSIEPNTVYIIPPAHHLLMNDGYLSAKPSERPAGAHVAIDLFFRDLADVHKERAFCIVLSGTGSDGAVGLSRIKEQGGITLVQAPEDAEFDGMPLAAIDTNKVDFVLPVVEMPQKLLELWQNSKSIVLPTTNDPEIETKPPNTEREAVAAEQTLQDILHLLRSGTGHDFKHYKRATVLRRIERRMQVTAQSDLAAYYDYLKSHPEETKALLGDMLIGVTNFFRDREAFDALERHVVPNILQSLQDTLPHRDEVRVWSAGCSTGEEAYSIAIVLNEYMAEQASSAKLQVFATDIDDRAIAFGRQGVYPEAIATDVAQSRVRQNFISENHQLKIRKDLREKVLFAQHSLLLDPPFSHIDLIVCRNLLIYLDRKVQREIMQMFHFALRPGGYLFLGNSESIDDCSDLFAPIDKRHRIFRAKSTENTARRAPALPRSGYGRAPIATDASMPAKPLMSTRVSIADVHSRALVRTAPASIVIDSEANILHVSETAGCYLRYVAGEVTRNLLAVAHPDLRIELRTTLFQVQQTGFAFSSRKVSIKRDARDYLVDITAHPYKDAETENNYLLIVFNEQESVPQESCEHSGHENQMLASLELELQRTKLQMQEIIEQSEVSSEELKASNEEMQAINEELRSATEELETSKEELQSINEELLTVNYELKIKVEETDKVNDYLTNLITSSDLATVFVDRNMRIRWFTPQASEVFSMLPVDTGRSLLDITHRLNYPNMAEDATLVFESLNMIEREVISNDQRWYIARLLPYRSRADHIDGTILTFIDITKRRAAEEEVRRSEERLRLVAESTHDFAIIILDHQGLITDWNRGAELIFGYTKQEIMGAYYELIFLPEDCASGVPENELRTARLKGRADDERWHQRKDGTRFFCSGEVTLLQGENVQGYVKIARDLTGHKISQEEQTQRLVATQNKSHLKDEFFAVMSHELKHPLNLIQLNAELLRRLPAIKTVAPAIKAVNTVCEAVANQARIIDDLLDVARVRTGKLKLKKQPVDLGRVLQDIYALVANDDHQGKVKLALPPTSEPPLVIDADATRLEQIIWNLVNNALKFTSKEGCIELIATKHESMAQLDVIDSGVGLDEEDLQQVFDLFSQAESQHATHQREGLGIGLSLVRQLVEAHGGSVAVYSKGIGYGSTFTIRLPLCTPDQVPGDLAQASEKSGRLKGVRVLLVDDSRDVLEVLQMLLEMEDAEVAGFSDPPQALNAARKGTFDVIISDIGMPGMDGYQFIQALRQITGLENLPAIALTGYGAPSDKEKIMQSGFNFHVGKPISHDEFIDIIDGACNK